MRVSEYYVLPYKQGSLDFVDVDINDDVRLHIDPFAIRHLNTLWGNECVSLIQDFFSHVLQLISAGKGAEAKKLLSAMSEPAETHLGLCHEGSNGRAVGKGLAQGVFHALSQSQAVHRGLISNLEDTVLLIEGIGHDIVSDITTCIIREPLINYTCAMCESEKIPLARNVASGALWDPLHQNWYNEYVDLPIINDCKILFVPKSIVRTIPEYKPDDYYNNFILEKLKSDELMAGTALVKLLKNGKRIVSKRSLKEKYGTGKKVILQQTLKSPQLLEDYKQAKQRNHTSTLSHRLLARAVGCEEPDWELLLENVVSLRPGRAAASKYETAILALTKALFYPSLVNPISQAPQHNGRKRVDIEFSNAAESGFFRHLSLHYPAGQIFVECKNYSSDPANPELDQLSGRFSPTRGKVGILVARKFKDKDLFIQRCKDTANDDRGFIIVLDDDDLSDLVAEVKTEEYPEYKLLMTRFRELVS